MSRSLLLTYHLTCLSICCLHINSFVFCTFSLISNKKSIKVTPNICCKIKSIVLIISSQENVKLKYLRIKFYSLFTSCAILTSCAKSNTCVSMGMMPNCSARYELTFCVSFYFLCNQFWRYNLLKIRKSINSYGYILK